MKQHTHLTLEHVPSTPSIGTSIDTLTERLRAIARVATGVYETHEHSLRLPFDAAMRGEVAHCAQRYWTNQLRFVLVIGIGGSNLGAKAVYDALSSSFGSAEGKPKMLFADTVSPRFLTDLEHLLLREVSYPEEIVINLISKSGATTESVVNAEIILAMLAERFPEILARVVVTTDRDSPLWKIAEKEGLGVLPIPKEVGGRFSVFSPVGLFPLALAGIDVDELCAGGRDAFETALEEENAPLRLATAVFRSMRSGVSVLNFFLFNPEMESMGKWARQLYGESLGKEKDRTGKTIHAGITPIVSIGSTDLHSMAQLYLGGPRDKFTLFTYISERTHRRVPKKGVFLPLVAGVAGRSPDEVMSAIYQGVRSAYMSHRLPFGELAFSAVSPYALGQFFEFHMLTVIYLGELLHVNTFDQPNVEDYKRVTRSILEHPHHS
jgi:glucose-6-phosphate isomerase